MKHCIKLTITLLFLLFSTSAFAVLYKSVDADGNVTYSQSPPKSGDYKTIKVKKFKPTSPATVSKKSMDAKKTFEQGAHDRKENDLVKNEIEKNKKIMEDNCKIAKKNLRLFTIFKRLKNEQGEYYRVSDTEREERIKMAKGNIKQYCN